MGTEPNGSLAGRLTTGAGIGDPVPVSETLCMLPAAALLLSVKLSEALSADVVAGVKVIETVQFDPAATVLAVEQVIPVIAKSPAFAPATEGLLENVRGPVPVFINVTTTVELVECCGMVPKDVLGGRVT